MGYGIFVDLENVCIPPKHRVAALDAINDAHASHHPQEYDWVPNPPGGAWKSLDEAIRAWRYSGSTTDFGDYQIEWFEGEKLGSCQVLWKALAPFLKSGGIVDFRGEDGCQWRYTFADGKITELEGEVVWKEV